MLINKAIKPEDSEIYGRYAQLMTWVDEHRKLKVRTNSDEPEQAEGAISFGAEGIGLCRTEHMFFDHITDFPRDDSRQHSRRSREGARQVAATPAQDFDGIFRAMAGKPVTIRLLDPPLHEFLPHTSTDQKDLAERLDLPVIDIERRVEELHEFNPMLGHRGCRLGIVYPEITRMQARAIIEAACDVKKDGVDVLPEIMVPLVGFKTELADQEKIIRETAAKVFAEKGVEVEYMVGTMIELPRAAMCADQIAEVAEFFSFGTNDLTQTTLGMSRDDYGPFITDYRENDIIGSDPFQTIDQDGVGRVMRIGVEGGQKGRPGIKLGICGEHGGDPSSVMFCHKLGLEYVSCSPYRVPIARLAAAQAAVMEKRGQ